MTRRRARLLAHWTWVLLRRTLAYSALLFACFAVAGLTVGMIDAVPGVSIPIEVAQWMTALGSGAMMAGSVLIIGRRNRLARANAG